METGQRSESTSSESKERVFTVKCEVENFHRSSLLPVTSHAQPESCSLIDAAAEGKMNVRFVNHINYCELYF